MGGRTCWECRGNIKASGRGSPPEGVGIALALLPSGWHCLFIASFWNCCTLCALSQSLICIITNPVISYTDCPNMQSCLPGALRVIGHFVWATSMRGLELMPPCLTHLRPWGFAVCSQLVGASEVKTVASGAHGGPSMVLGPWGCNRATKAGTAVLPHALQRAPAPGGFQRTGWQGQTQLGWRKLYLSNSHRAAARVRARASILSSPATPPPSAWCPSCPSALLGGLFQSHGKTMRKQYCVGFPACDQSTSYLYGFLILPLWKC